METSFKIQTLKLLEELVNREPKQYRPTLLLAIEKIDNISITEDAKNVLIATTEEAFPTIAYYMRHLRDGITEFFINTNYYQSLTK